MKSRLLLVAALLLLIAVVPAISDASDADGPKKVVFIDGTSEYDVQYAVGPLTPPADPGHHGLTLVGWAYNGKIVDVTRFDFSSLPQDTVYLHAVYQDDPAGSLMDNIVFIGVVVMMVVFGLLMLVVLFMPVRPRSR